MTPTNLPAVALQSSSDCCWVCLYDREVQCRPIGESTPVVIPCPHCVAIDRLWTVATPVPCRGRLGLWTVPDGVTAAVAAQLRAVAR